MRRRATIGLAHREEAKGAKMEKALWEFFCERCKAVVLDKVLESPATDADEVLVRLRDWDVPCGECGEITTVRHVDSSTNIVE